MARINRSEARERRHRRIRKSVHGTADAPRLAVFRSLSEIYAQVIDDDKGETIVSASTVDKEIKPLLGDKNKSEQAKLVGKIVAERAEAKGVKTVVFDRGGFRFIGRVKHLADAAREAGLQF